MESVRACVRKRFKRTNSKHFEAQKPALSGTSKQHVPVELPKSPAKCAAELGPWIEFANLVSLPDPIPADEYAAGIRHPPAGPKEFAQFHRGCRAAQFEESPHFPLSQIKQLSTKMRPPFDMPADFELAQTVLTILFCLSSPAHRAELAHSTDVLIKPASNGLLRSQLFNPLSCFLSALEDIDPSRIRRCPICRKVFFAFRRTKDDGIKDCGTKACSKSCNETRRKRVWRENEDKYEYRRIMKANSSI